MPRTSGSGISPRDEREEYIALSGKAVLFFRELCGADVMFCSVIFPLGTYDFGSQVCG